jgi:phosphopantetheinyl transferase
MTETLMWRSARRRPSQGLGTAWLTDVEKETYAELKAERRRQEWLIGRRLAKELILEAMTDMPLNPRDVEISSRDGLGRRTRPRIVIAGRAQPWSLSIAHSDDLVLVALSTDARVSLGVDIVPVQSWTKASLESWFTETERQWMETGAMRPSTVWAVKEAVYKAVNRGEPFVPQRIEVRPNLGGAYSYLKNGRAPLAGAEIRVSESNEEIMAITTVTDGREGVAQ